MSGPTLGPRGRQRVRIPPPEDCGALPGLCRPYLGSEEALPGRYRCCPPWASPGGPSWVLHMPYLGACSSTMGGTCVGGARLSWSVFPGAQPLKPCCAAAIFRLRAEDPMFCSRRAGGLIATAGTNATLSGGSGFLSYVHHFV